MFIFFLHSTDYTIACQAKHLLYEQNNITFVVVVPPFNRRMAVLSSYVMILQSFEHNVDVILSQQKVKGSMHMHSSHANTCPILILSSIPSLNGMGLRMSNGISLSLLYQDMT